MTSVSAGPSESSSASSQGVAEGASQRSLSPRMVEVLAARIGRGAKDFHIARVPRLIRTVLRMGVVFTCDNYNVGNCYRITPGGLLTRNQQTRILNFLIQ